ncbi:ParB/RepB/Spo0J family partition protein [Pseudooceanicola nanhaiensis]|uniref:ParB/RepB/Spo0J family partition protein n=1 Tax=Pseudooceanicola nanhaiensis TaxID=375761 RepID=UPI001CD1DE4E|nr:ParB N-terminal domain-containing protein [Pseudooceanicola nanhaiensis]MCA0922800.1 ParB N-terminal domain-containing protein [Pseudooceanicola nanhaiensis]
MAKRRRLTPANPDHLSSAPPATASEARAIFPAGGGAGALPDTPARPRPPVADMAGSASAHAALGELAETLERARAEGRMVLELPLDAVESGYLVRDRVALDEEEMQALMESLRARGQQTPVEVVDLGEGRYGLISGWRRCRALRRLHEETGEPRFARVLALLRRPEVSAEAYVAMVEENEIRVGLSYYERARIAAKAADQGVFETVQAALRGLFAAASRAKRSKIGSFVTIVRALDGQLRFPEALGERAGLSLAKALETDPALAGRIAAALDAAPPTDPAAELALVERLMTEGRQPATSGGKSAGTQASTPARGKAQDRAPRAAEQDTVHLEAEADGTLRLSGPGVDAAFRARLEDWLRRG